MPRLSSAAPYIQALLPMAVCAPVACLSVIVVVVVLVLGLHANAFKRIAHFTQHIHRKEAQRRIVRDRMTKQPTAVNRVT